MINWVSLIRITIQVRYFFRFNTKNKITMMLQQFYFDIFKADVRFVNFAVCSLQCYVTAGCCAVAWFSFPFTRFFLFLPLVAFNLVLQKLLGIQPVFNVSFVHNDHRMIPFAGYICCVCRGRLYRIVCTVVAAPRKTEMITTIGREPMPISAGVMHKFFQYILKFSGRVNMPLIIRRYRPLAWGVSTFTGAYQEFPAKQSF